MRQRVKPRQKSCTKPSGRMVWGNKMRMKRKNTSPCSWKTSEPTAYLKSELCVFVCENLKIVPFGPHHINWRHPRSDFWSETMISCVNETGRSFHWLQCKAVSLSCYVSILVYLCLFSFFHGPVAHCSDTPIAPSFVVLFCRSLFSGCFVKMRSVYTLLHLTQWYLLAGSWWNVWPHL